MGNMCVDNRVNDLFLNLTGKRLNTMNEALSRAYFISICERVINDLHINVESERYDAYLVLGTMLGIEKYKIDNIYKMHITAITTSSDYVQPFVDYGRMVFKQERPNLILGSIMDRMYKCIESCRNVITFTIKNRSRGQIPTLVRIGDMELYSMLYLILFLDRYCINISLDVIIFILTRVTGDADGTIARSKELIKSPEFKLKLSCADKFLKVEVFQELKMLVRSFNRMFILHGLENLN